MKVTQISVFLENKSGRLAEVAQALAQQRINIRALSIADTIDYGVLRLIVNDPHGAREALDKAGFTATETDVIAVEMPDQPGALAKIIRLLSDQNINIEYGYAFVGRSGENAIVVFRIDALEEAIRCLTEAGVRLLKAEEVYAI
ncbi:amino acid-binding protein [candidate division KD3-62 bacterium DG_56]|uniref:Amino acid-binding protein n=1 Tax=candidate division KD3-62 bacterium DG_56 TaxID=1704032 RepID=A0A0S7XRA8_9BACT|nr:MAG: amino acid-binding protein [candidate division KD3-62 bacterium DG_56]